MQTSCARSELRQLVILHLDNEVHGLFGVVLFEVQNSPILQHRVQSLLLVYLGPHSDRQLGDFDLLIIQDCDLTRTDESLKRDRLIRAPKTHLIIAPADLSFKAPVPRKERNLVLASNQTADVLSDFTRIVIWHRS